MRKFYSEKESLLDKKPPMLKKDLASSVPKIRQTQIYVSPLLGKKTFSVKLSYFITFSVYVITIFICKNPKFYLHFVSSIKKPIMGIFYVLFMLNIYRK
jgi:hypothetical protein